MKHRNKDTRLGCATCFVILLLSALNVFPRQREAVHIKIDLAKTGNKRQPIWAWFGYDEPNFTYMKDGRKLLGEIAALSSVPVYVRTHSLLVTGDGTASLKWGSTNAYTEDENQRPVYD